MAIFVSEDNTIPPIAGTPSDMSSWDLSDYDIATVLGDTSAEFRIQIGGVIWTFTGSGFTYDGNNRLATGTITGFTIEEGGTVWADVSDFSMNVATVFKPFMVSNDTEGFREAVFIGNDDIDSAYHALGHSGDDTITNAVIAYGGSGDDTITLTASADTFVDGGLHDDTLIFAGGTLPIDRIFGGAGNDVFMGAFEVDTGFRADTADFERIGDTTIDGNGGDNDVDLRAVVKDPNGYTEVEVIGRGGKDRLWGVSDGATALFGGSGNDRLDTGTADDRLYGGKGRDFMVSGFGDDIIEDTNGQDKARGAAGNDTITVGGGGDIVSGDEDNDILISLGGIGGAETILRGGAGMDIMTGEGRVTYLGDLQDDIFNLYPDNLKAFGDPGGDTFNVNHAATLSSMERIEGGSGLDEIVLADVGAPVTISTIIINVELLTTHGGVIFVDDAALGAGEKLTVDGGDTQAIDFNASAELDARFVVHGTDFNDRLIGGAGKDEFHAGDGDDIIVGGGDKDTVNFTFTDDPASILNAADRVDGGAGDDTLNLSGLYADAQALTLAADTIADIETIVLLGGNATPGDPFKYDLTFNNGNIASGDLLTVDSTDLIGEGRVVVDGSAETDGRFSFVGGSSSETFIGGGSRDTLAAGGAADLLTGGRGGDLFAFADVSHSTGKNFDVITDLNAAEDSVGLEFAVTAVDAQVNGGVLSRNTFDNDLEAAVGGGDLAAGHAVLFAPDAGFYSGELFLVVDANGSAGYQGEEDVVIMVTGATNLASLATAFQVI